MYMQVGGFLSILKVIQNRKYEKKIMEIFVHFIYNVVQIKEHIDQYFHTYFIRFELNKYLFF